MQGKSLDKFGGIGFPLLVRLAMLALNFVPVLHLALTAALVYRFVSSPELAILIFLTGIYLVPPICVRTILLISPIRKTRVSLISREFLTWWATLQFQILFCRFLALEEALRMVPGLYSLWLRLWGAKIGRLTYWAAGVIILDRPFLTVGDDVIFGAGVRMSAHVLEQAKPGQQELLLDPIIIGYACSVGAYSLLACGTVLRPGQALKARSLSPPFSLWKDGLRVKKETNL